MIFHRYNINVHNISGEAVYYKILAQKNIFKKSNYNIFGGCHLKTGCIITAGAQQLEYYYTNNDRLVLQ